MDMFELTRMASITTHKDKDKDINANANANSARDGDVYNNNNYNNRKANNQRYNQRFNENEEKKIVNIYKLPRKTVTSSPLVQMLLYYNSFFSLSFAFLEGMIIVDKMKNYVYYSGLQRGSTAPVYIMWLVVEPLRLLLAYTGNLQERVPQMSAFLLMTIFPQIPSLIFLAIFQEHIFPYDRIAGSILLFFMLIEVVVGLASLRGLIRKSTAEFYRMCQNQNSTFFSNPNNKNNNNHRESLSSLSSASFPSSSSSSSSFFPLSGENNAYGGYSINNNQNNDHKNNNENNAISSSSFSSSTSPFFSRKGTGKSRLSTEGYTSLSNKED